MISTIILTHNGGQLIERTLKSVSWCDEIIIIDDFSTDKTLNIAKKYTSAIYQRHLNGDFAAQRNFGLEKAKGPARNASHSDAGGEWVFFVDSDEVVSLNLASEIKGIFASKEKIQNSKFKVQNQYVGFYIKRKDWFLGKWLRHGETANIKLLRLAKKDAGQWVRPVHEVWDIHGNIGELSASLEHYPHPNVAQFLEEINTYSIFNAQYLYSQKTQVKWWQIIAYPMFKFLQNYFFRLGFLDGTPGAILALMMSFHSFLTRAKLCMLYDQENK